MFTSHCKLLWCLTTSPPTTHPTTPSSTPPTTPPTLPPTTPNYTTLNLELRNI